MAWPDRVVRLVLVGLLGCSFALLCAAERAGADPYVPPVPSGGATEPSTAVSGSCPDGPVGPYEGEDHAAGELRQLRAELAEVCEAVVGHQVEQLHRAWWQVAEALAAAEQRVTTNDLLAEVKDRLEPPIAVKQAGTVEVQDATSEQYSDDIVSAVDASGGATKEGIWFLIGVTLLIAAAAFFRWVKP